MSEIYSKIQQQQLKSLTAMVAVFGFSLVGIQPLKVCIWRSAFWQPIFQSPKCIATSALNIKADETATEHRVWLTVY